MTKKLSAWLICALLLLQLLPAAQAFAAVAGTLKDKDGNNVTAWLSLENTVTSSTYNVWVSGGSFDLTGLTPGDYKAVRYYDEVKQNYVNLNYSFSVNEDGTTTPSTVAIQAPAGNVNGTLSTLAAGVWLDIYKDGPQRQYFNVKTEAGGAFSVLLEDGAYVLQGYWDPGTQDYTKINKAFTVAGSANLGTVQVPAKNVTGTISPAVTAGMIQFYSVGGNSQQWYDARVGDDSTFKVALPDGDYRAAGYWSNSGEYIQLNTGFTVAGNTNITVKVPEKNVTGTLRKTSGSGPVIGDVWLNIRSKPVSSDAPTTWYNATVRSDGTFELSLDSGTYIIDGYWDNSENDFIRLNEEFTASETPLTLNVVVPDRNVVGTLSLPDTMPVDRAWLDIQDMNDPSKWYGARVNAGTFKLYLPDGNYKIRSFWDEAAQESVVVGAEFIVSGGTVTGGLDITVPEKNVTGTFTRQDGGTVNDISLQISNRNNYDLWYNATVKGSDTTGTFAVALPDGSYVIDGFWDPALNEFIRLNQNFEVSGSTAVSVTAQERNVSGTVQDPNVSGAPINGEIQLRSKTSDRWYGARIKNNAFSLALPAGDYQIDGYWNEDTREFTQHRQDFSVVDASQTVTVSVSISSKNVTGTLKQFNGDLIPNVWMNVVTDNYPKQYYGFRANDEGRFTAALPNGSYTVEGYYDETEQTYVRIQQKIAVEGNTNVEITVPQRNVTGILKDENGDIVANGSLNIRTSAEPFEWYNADTNLSGEFKTALPNGSYVIDGFWKDGNFKKINRTINVNGMTDLGTVSVPPSNIAGTLKDSDGASVNDAWLQLDRFNGQYYEGESLKVTNGAFSGRLPAGEYKIRGYHVNGTNEYVTLDSQKLQITVSDTSVANIDIVTMGANVTGTLMKEDGTPITDTYLNIRRASENSSAGVEVKDGQFKLYLTDGSYIVEGFWDRNENRYVRLRVPFTVESGVSNPNPLNLTVQDDNVNGSIHFEGRSTAVNGEVGIIKKDSAGQFLDWFSATVIDGKFSLFLEDGNYEVNNFYDQSSQKQVQLSYGFSVSNGLPSPNPLAIAVPKDNVRGSFAFADGTVPQYGHIEFISSDYRSYQTQIGNGAFSVFLPDGDYAVNYFTDDTSSIQLRYLQIKFSIRNGVANVGQLSVIAPAKNIAGTVTKADGTAFTGNLMLYRWTGDNSITDEDVFHPRVTKGKLSTALPDGEYQFVNAWEESQEPNNPGEETNLSGRFTVTNGIPSLQPFDIVIPKKNVNLNVKREDGLELRGNLFIVKNTSNGYGDSWIGANIQNGIASLALEPGSYTINSFYDFVADEEVNLYQQFTVVSGQNTQTSVVIPRKNVFGTVKNDTGALLAGGNVRIRNTSTGLEYFARIKDGKFGAALPDGSYVISEYVNWETNDSVPLQVAFTVTNKVPNPSTLNVALPKKNVTGTLKYQDGAAVTGTTVMIRPLNDPNTIYNSFVINGSFSIYLPDGTYEIREMYKETSNGWITSNIGSTFTVSGGMLSGPLNVTVPNSNVKGTFKKPDGTAVSAASLVFEKAGTDLYYYASVSNGNFQLFLPNGTYTVKYYYDEELRQDMVLSKEYTVTVTNGTASPSSLSLVKQ